MPPQSESRGVSSLLHFAGAILAGYTIYSAAVLLFFHLTHKDPHALVDPNMETLGVFFGMVVAFLSGYVAAILCGRLALLVAVCVAFMITLQALIYMIFRRNDGAPLPLLSTFLLVGPSALIGGRLAKRHQQREQ